MRKMLVLLALAVVTAGSVGCAGRFRHMFRRGSPCVGTARVAPAAIGATLAIAAPISAPAPRAQPLVMPQVIQQPACCPQPGPACEPCDPCPTYCSPCDSASTGEYFGGYVDSSIVEGDCQNCGSNTTYDQGTIVPGSEIPAAAAPEGSSTRQDPGPTTEN